MMPLHDDVRSCCGALVTQHHDVNCVLSPAFNKPDMVNHPPHYKDRVPGIECIDVTKHFDFCRGNAIKYLWRAGLKGDSTEQTLQDLKKAIWYIQKEINDLDL